MLSTLIDVFSLMFDRWLAMLYRILGMKPWKLGYSAYKRRLIESYIRSGAFCLDSWPAGYGYRVDERIVEYPWLFSRLQNHGEYLLDAGSTLNYRQFIRRPILAKKNLFILTLAPERRNYVANGVSYIFGDLRDCCFRDAYFDTIVSISTIEHIGLDNTRRYTTDVSKKEMRPQDYLLAIAEFHRILKQGGKLLLSFPFGVRSNCGWYQVFDRTMVLELLERFHPSSYTAWYFRYHADGWRPATPEDCADATICERQATKRYEEDFVAFSRAVCCLELRK
jgi:SAM-dependent methyltransferase